MEGKEGVGWSKFWFVQHVEGKNKENDVGSRWEVNKWVQDAERKSI